MQQLNRKIPPGFRAIEKISYVLPEKQFLSNGIPVYLIHTGDQDVLRIELLFSAGNRVEPAPLVASATNAMLNEGTTSRTAEEIAEQFDFYGSFFQLHTDKDHGGIILYTLSKYAEQGLELVADIIDNSTFPEKEFQTWVRKRKQQYVEDLSRVKTIAGIQFMRAVFGQEHPYGTEVFPENFDNLTIEPLAGFYRKHYLESGCTAIVSGKIPSGFLPLLDRYLGQRILGSPEETDNITHIPLPAFPSRLLVEKENAIQSAVRIGKALFNKNHPDFIGMLVLNTVLGGYFGSRLMKNIREEKGYTYGISSVVMSMLHGGFFSIAAEVGIGVCRDAIREIYQEIEKLRNQPVPEDELTLVKNYLLGEMVRMFDGPFAQAESCKSVIAYGLDYSFFDRTIDTIRSITPDQLRDLAVLYLEPDTLTEIVAGKY